LLDVSEEKQNESLNLSIEIDDNNILYLSPPSPQQQHQTAEKNDKNNTTSLLDITTDIRLTPSTSFLQLDMSVRDDDKELNVLECSEITLGSSFLIEADNSEIINKDIAAVDISLSSRLDVSDNMDGDEFEIVMNTHQDIKRETISTEGVTATESIDTPLDKPLADEEQHALNNSTITCDEFITEAVQTSFIENVKLGYNVVTNKLEKEFIDMGFADCVSG